MASANNIRASDAHHPRPIPFNQFGLEKDEKQKNQADRRRPACVGEVQAYEGRSTNAQGVAALHTRWNDTKHRTFPCCSPNNSDDKEEEDNKEEEDVNDEEGGEMGTIGLVFGHEESEDESDD
jgi:hypothetical protein